MTHYQLLSRHFQQGYPADEKDNTKRVHAVPNLKSLYVAAWEKLISKVIYQGYYQATNDFFFSMSADAVWAVCPGHQRKYGDTASWWGKQTKNSKTEKPKTQKQNTTKAP